MNLTISNPKLLLRDINVHAKFSENWSKTTQVKSPETKHWRMDRHSKQFGGNNIIPRHFFVEGFEISYTCMDSSWKNSWPILFFLVRVYCNFKKNSWPILFFLVRVYCNIKKNSWPILFFLVRVYCNIKKNKSFSYQDTLPMHSFLICILNFDKTSKIFSKCNHLFGRHLGETHFVHKSRAITQLKNKEKQNVIG